MTDILDIWVDNNPLKTESGFTPKLLSRMAKTIESLRHDFLYDENGDADTAGFDMEAEQFYLSALALLETAQRQMTLASLKQMQALAAHRR